MFRTAFFAAIVCVFATSSAFAFDANARILDLSGHEIPLCSAKTPECEKPTTVRFVVVNALMAQLPSERDLSADKKLERFDLALKLQSAEGDVKLDAEKTALIKKMVGAVYNPLIVGRVFQIIDPASVSK